VLFKNINYHILLVEEEVEGQRVDLYHVINNFTGVVEHRTIIMPDALQTAEEFNDALVEFETIYKSSSNDYNDQETLH
jgi:hypothetical protein